MSVRAITLQRIHGNVCQADEMNEGDGLAMHARISQIRGSKLDIPKLAQLWVHGATMITSSTHEPYVKVVLGSGTRPQSAQHGCVSDTMARKQALCEGLDLPSATQ